MSQKEFIEIFKSFGVDKEWAEVIWGRIPHKETISLNEVKEIAAGWAEDKDSF